MEQKRFAYDNLVEAILEDMKETTKHKLVRKGGTGKYVVGDKERLGQVLLNVLSNAIKYSPRADKVVITTKVKNGSILTSVQDFGIGIDKQYHQKIFERFFRVTGPDEKTYPGMGIGLHLCADILHRHGGDIWVESQKGKGSTFHFSLPLTKKN